MNDQDYLPYKKRHNRFYKTAKQLLLEDGQLSPVLFIQAGTQLYTLPMHMPDTETKRKFISVATGFAKRLNAEAVFLVYESWVVASSDPKVVSSGRLACAPSKHPEKREVLSVSCWINGKGGTILMGKMIRDKNNSLCRVDDDGSNGSNRVFQPVGGDELFANLCGELLPDDHPCMDVPKEFIQEMITTMVKIQPNFDAVQLKHYKKRFKKTLH